MCRLYFPSINQVVIHRRALHRFTRSKLDEAYEEGLVLDAECEPVRILGAIRENFYSVLFESGEALSQRTPEICSECVPGCINACKRALESAFSVQVLLIRPSPHTRTHSLYQFGFRVPTMASSVPVTSYCTFLWYVLLGPFRNEFCFCGVSSTSMS